jgi:filamentous hemagglutinin family protein
MFKIFKLIFFICLLTRVLILDVYSQIPTNTLPSLKTIDSGSVTVSSANNSLNINQSSQQAIISWNSFNVGSTAKVNFNQPSASATTLNKIFDANPSQIFGQINANGKIILQNSAGIYFGPSSTLNVGSIVATTGTISNQDFLNNKLNFSRNNSTGNIVNQGSIKALDDFVALLSSNIRNEGLIFAQKGSIVLSTGDEVTLNFQTNGYLSSIASTPSSINTLIQNNKAIEAPGGQIILSARAISDLVSGVINQNGTVNSGSQASTVVNKGGKIFLEASNIKISSNSSTISKAKDIGGDISIIANGILIDSNAVINASGNSAGNIKIVANQDNLEIKDSQIRSNSQLGDTGAIALSAVKNLLISGSIIEATGVNKGGKILLGYDFAGQSLPFAQNASFDEKTYINASATSGTGTGGFVETSGKTLYIRSRVNVGRGGQWLVDPYDFVIDDTIAGFIVSAIDSGSNVSLTTSTQNYSSYSLLGVDGQGDITLNAPIVATNIGGGSLSLTAARNIYLNKLIDLSGTASTLTLIAGDIIYYAADVTTKNNQTYNAVTHQINAQSTLESKNGNILITGDIYASYNIIAFLGNGNYLLNDLTTLLQANQNDQVVYDSQTDTYQLLTKISTADALIVAGGGGGGGGIGGGGGGGGVITQTVSLNSDSIYVTVGAGGTGGQFCSCNNNINSATNGQNSTLQTANNTTLAAIGGGSGGSGSFGWGANAYGSSGGSGGGSSGWDINGRTDGAGAGTIGQGNNGGVGGPHNHMPGGGGGAGTTASTPDGNINNWGSNGGAGVQNNILGNNYYWAGGGGGSGWNGYSGNGGLGGGGGGAGNGSNSTGGIGFNNGAGGNIISYGWGGNGGVNTGGGGGAGRWYGETGGNGGSGIVALKYKTTLTLIANSGSVNIAGNVVDAGLNISNATASQINGIISGSSALIKSGSGSLTLLTANTYSGDTTVSTGSLIIGASNAFSPNSKLNLDGTLDLEGRSAQSAGLTGSGTITSSSSGTYNINIGNSDTNAFFGNIVNGTGTLSLTKSGDGDLILSGNNTYTGGTNFNGGIITLNSSTAIGSSGTISFAGGELKYSDNNSTDYSSRFSAASGQLIKVNTNSKNITWATNILNSNSSITKNGDGKLTLSGTIGVNNTDAAGDGYNASLISPAITLNAGTIQFSTINSGFRSLTTATDTNVIAPFIRVTGISNLGGTITTNGLINFIGAVTLNSDTNLISNNNIISFGSTIDAQDDNIVNSYKLLVNAGTSTATFNNNIGSTYPISDITVTANSGITLNGDVTLGISLGNGLLFEKFRGSNGANDTTSYANLSPTIIYSSESSNVDGTKTSFIGTEINLCKGGGCDDNYSYRITGYFKPQNSGVYTFALFGDDGNHFYIGSAGQKISDFVTAVQATSNNSDPTKGWVIGNYGCCSTVTGTTPSLTKGQVYPVFFNISEGGGGDYLFVKFKEPGVQSFISGSSTVNNSYFGTSSDGQGYFYYPNSGTNSVTLNGPVTIGSNVTINSAGQPININGTLSSDNSNRNLSLNASSFTVGAVSNFNNLSVRTSSFTADNISNVNTLNLDSSEINISGTLSVNQHYIFINSQDLTFSNILAGAADLTKQGSGVLTLTGQNTFTGGVNLNEGTLSLGVAEDPSFGPLGKTGLITFNGGTLQFTSSNQYDYSSRFSSADNQQFIIDTQNNNVTFASALRGTGSSLTKLGGGANSYYGGVLTLTGHNTFTGGVYLNGGTISLGVDENPSFGPLGKNGTITFYTGELGDDVHRGATLQFTSNNQYDYSSRFSSADNQHFSFIVNDSSKEVKFLNPLVSSGGDLIVRSATGNTQQDGYLNLAAVVQYDGLTTVYSNLRIGTNNSLANSSGVIGVGSANLDLNGYSTIIKSLNNDVRIFSSQGGNIDLTIGDDNDSTFSGSVNQNPAIIRLIKEGSGKLILVQSNYYSGGTVLNNGVLEVGVEDSIGTTGNIRFNGGTLRYGQSTYAVPNTADYSYRLDPSSGQSFKIDTNGKDIVWANDLLNDSSTLLKIGSSSLIINGTIGVNNSDSNQPDYNGSFIPLNLTVSEGLLSFPNTIKSLGNISVQGGSFNCPNCPSLGDISISTGASATFDNATFNTLTLADGVTINAISVIVLHESTLGGSITTQGIMSFIGPVTLVANTNLTSSNNTISFGSTIDGFKNLTIDAGNSTVAFGGAIGATTKLASLSVNALGGIYLNDVSIQGFADGLLFEKFNSNSPNFVDDASNLGSATTKTIYSWELPGAPGNETKYIYNEIRVCNGGNCDEYYAYRVTGYFIPKSTGIHTFNLTSDDSSHLYIGTAGQKISDFKTVIESSSSYSDPTKGQVVGLAGCCTTVTGDKYLTAGKIYPIYVSFSEGWGGDYLWIKFKEPGANNFVQGTTGYSSSGQGYFYNLSGNNMGVNLTGPVTLTKNTTLDSGNASVIINGAINGGNSKSDLTINATSLNAKAISNITNLTINVSERSLIEGVISGGTSASPFALIKEGAGSLELDKNNIFIGNTTINAGTIALSDSGSLGNVSNLLTIGNGTLTIKDRNQTFYNLVMGANSTIDVDSNATYSSLTLPKIDLSNSLTSFTLGGSITTKGIQSYQGAITLAGDITLLSNDNNITFGQGASVNGNAYNFTINTGSGTASLGSNIRGVTNLSSLGTTSVSTTSISTIGTQIFGAFTFSQPLSLQTVNSDISFSSTVSGTKSLTVDVGQGTVSFNDIVGQNNEGNTLNSLSVTGKTFFAADVYTVNDQSYSNDISLKNSVNLKSFLGNITIGGNITAVAYETIALLGSGQILFNNDSKDLTNDTDTILTHTTYNSSTGLYSWIAQSPTAQTLVVAGGGGGGSLIGGGGGGGGVIIQDSNFVKGSTYNISVGAGGTGQAGRYPWETNAATNGQNSTLQTSNNTTLTAIGGGAGGSGSWGWNGGVASYGSAGGSGGGAAGWDVQYGYSNRGGSGTQGQGFTGGSGGPYNHMSGGGGGAGGTATINSESNQWSSSGGPGVQSNILGTNYYWGGGGGGSAWQDWNAYSGNGGAGGGGGAGGNGPNTTGGSGFNSGSPGVNFSGVDRGGHGGNGGANTGGGGGGAQWFNNIGGNGGSGIVVLKYKTDSSLILNAAKGTVNLPSDLTVTDLSSFKIIQTSPKINFTNLSLVNSSFELKNQNLTTDTFSLDQNSSITTAINQTSTLEVTGTSSIGGSIETLGATFDKIDTATGKTAKWGQYYGELVTLIGNASFSSEGKNIHFNGIQGDHNLTISATPASCGVGITLCGGWVIFNGKVGDAPVVETDATVIKLNGSETAYHSNYDYLNFASASTLNVKSISVDANEIYIRADVITSGTQIYTGHVNIGDNGTNGVIRNLISIDPEIKFVGRSIYYKDGNAYKTSTNKYSFDDESLTPTHSLILIAKGYCYVTSGACGDAGNIRLAYNENGDKVYYNSIRPLKSLETNNKTMLFPDTSYYEGVNIDQIAISKGTIDGETSSNPESISGTPVSFDQFSTPVVEIVENNNPVRRTTEDRGDLISSSILSNNLTNSLREVPTQSFTGEVIIGGVQASFDDSGTFGSAINTGGSSGNKNSKSDSCKDNKSDKCI